MSASAKPVRKAYAERYNSLAPRFWHGMGTGTWFKLLARNRFDISLSRIPTALSISLATLFNSSAGLLEKAIYGRKVAQTKLTKPPLFIIGHWRSGTTLLHELMVKDPRHAFPSTCQCFAAKHFLLTEWLITHCLGFVMPKKRPMDDMDAGWDKPQEEEFALCNLGLPSPYLFLAFPDHGAVFDSYLTLDEVPEKEREAWKLALQRFIQKLAYRDPRRVVMKSPPHTGRVKAILEIYPDAQFVHIVRDPFKLYSSTLKLWDSLGFIQGMHVPKEEAWLKEYVLQSLETLYQQLEKDRELLRPDQLVELHYESLVANPVAEMERIYEGLDLGEFDSVRPGIEAYFANRSGYKTNRHELSDEVCTMIAKRWSLYMDRYGYSIPART